MIKLILSDMDGTLLDDQSRLPDGFDDMMAELKQRGVHFAPCSGRQYFSLLDSFAKYKDEFMFLAENGTLVRYQGRELFSSPMNAALGRQVLRAAENLPNISEVFCGKNNAYVLERQMSPVLQQELNKYYTHAMTVPDFTHVGDEMIKASFYDANGTAEQTVMPVLERFRGPLQVILSSAYWVDVMNFDINKGIAVQQVQRRLGITPMECAAFGDYMNDAEMMSSVYYSFAMANAHPKIKELARYSTTSNNEGGVLAGIRRLIDAGLC